MHKQKKDSQQLEEKLQNQEVKFKEEKEVLIKEIYAAKSEMDQQNRDIRKVSMAERVEVEKLRNKLDDRQKEHFAENIQMVKQVAEEKLNRVKAEQSELHSQAMAEMKLKMKNLEAQKPISTRVFEFLVNAGSSYFGF